jgi:hypothetical protein
MCLDCNQTGSPSQAPQGREYANYENAKAQLGECATPYRRPSLREQAEKSVGYHRDMADKNDRAVAFLRENPAFDQFVQLVREGVIQF